MSLSAEDNFNQNSKPTVSAEENFQNNTGVGDTPNFPVTEVEKPGLVKSLSQNIYGGMLDANSNFNKMIGLGAFDKTKELFVTPGHEQAAKIYQDTESDNPVHQFSNEFSRGIGSLLVDLPVQVSLGMASKMALVGQMVPEAVALLSKIPDFAVGMGIEKGIQTAEQGKEPVVPALEGTAMGMVYGQAGESGPGIAGHLSTIPKLSAVGMAESAYNAFKEGRKPTKDELIKGASMGAAYGAVFSILPILRTHSEGKASFDNLQSKIQDVIDQHHGASDPKEGTDAIRESVDALMKDSSVSPDAKRNINALLEADKAKENFRDSDLLPTISKMKEASVALMNAGTGLVRGIQNIFNPATEVIKQYGLEEYAKVQRAIHTPDAEIIGFNNTRSSVFDQNFGEIEKFFSKFSDQDLRDFNLTRGEPEAADAKQLQEEAQARLKKSLGNDNLYKAVKETSDYVFNYAKENGLEFNYFEDYFFGAYKNDAGQVQNFLDYWRSTDKFTKEKSLPTVSDAAAYGLELKDQNPITNIKKEMRLVAQRVGLLKLKEQLLEGESEYAVELKPTQEGAQGAQMEQLKNWRKIEDPVFKGMLFSPEYAHFVNSLLSTNKVSSSPVLKAMRQLSYTMRQIKFFGSMFHMMNMAKASVSQEGAFSGEGYKDIAKSFKAIDESDPEFKDYANLGGGKGYSLDVEAQKQIDVAIEKIKKGNFLGGALRAPAALLEQKWIPASPGMIKWMFNEFIPSLKFTKFQQMVDGIQERMGRPATDGEKIETIKTINNWYGEINERLFGRSATVTSALRLIFSAPGYGEGNFRTIYKSLHDEIPNAIKTREITPEGSENTKFIASTLFTSLLMGTIGTLFATGKAPSVPKNGSDVRDLFKIKTDLKDGNGDTVYFDMMTYDKDYWSVFGNIASGKPGKVPEDLLKRVSGATSSSFRLLNDMTTIMNGGTVYDFKGDPIYFKTDDLTVKLKKFMEYEGVAAQPISLGTLTQSKDKGVGNAEALAASVIGIRSTTSEGVKEAKQARGDLFSLQDAKAQKQIELNKMAAENPEEASKQAFDFNKDQLKKLADISKKMGIEQVPPKSVLNHYLIENVKDKKVAKGTDIKEMFKPPQRKPTKKILTSEQKEEIVKLIKENF